MSSGDELLLESRWRQYSNKNMNKKLKTNHRRSWIEYTPSSSSDASDASDGSKSSTSSSEAEDDSTPQTSNGKVNVTENGKSEQDDASPILPSDTVLDTTQPSLKNKVQWIALSHGGLLLTPLRVRVLLSKWNADVKEVGYTPNRISELLGMLYFLMCLDYSAKARIVYVHCLPSMVEEVRGLLPFGDEGHVFFNRLKRTITTDIRLHFSLYSQSSKQYPRLLVQSYQIFLAGLLKSFLPATLLATRTLHDFQDSETEESFGAEFCKIVKGGVQLPHEDLTLRGKGGRGWIFSWGVMGRVPPSGLQRGGGFSSKVVAKKLVGGDGDDRVRKRSYEEGEEEEEWGTSCKRVKVEGRDEGGLGDGRSAEMVDRSDASPGAASERTMSLVNESNMTKALLANGL
ncbi:hypothetical protein HK097_005120 [Rhizophlyctis rosea]|uniref:Uncharacterized protein n=1 Tax=Rhizophlyctis rosea TaxID=64517 RepID=A0AAD5S2S2_9FUNG|nr:hypothetical protein HK097_005120 [Rhizophlyctis rosea]